LRTERLTKLYPDGDVSALSDVSVEIHRGEYVSIMGPSGSGKSTLLNLLGAPTRPPPGEVYFEGQPVSTVRSVDRLRAQKIGFIFQSFLPLAGVDGVGERAGAMFEGSKLSIAARVKRAAELLAS